MKICPNCNTQFDDTLAFCDKCGTPLVTAAPAQPVYTQPVAPAQPVYTQPVAPAPKNNKTTWLIVAIVAAFLVIVGIVVGVIFLTGDKDDKDDGESKSKTKTRTTIQHNTQTVPNNMITVPSTTVAPTVPSTTVAPTVPSTTVKPTVPNKPSGGNVPFTAGNIQGNKYVNEWAGFSVNLPAGWELEIYDDEFYAYENDGYSEIDIAYEEIDETYTLNDFLTAFEADIEAEGYDYAKSYDQLGGLTYNSYYITDGDEYYYALFAQKDNYIIMITVIADSEAELKSVLNCFQDL